MSTSIIDRGFASRSFSNNDFWDAALKLEKPSKNSKKLFFNVHINGAMKDDQIVMVVRAPGGRIAFYHSRIC